MAVSSSGTPARGDAGPAVDDEVTGLHGGGKAAATAQHSADTGHQLGHLEGFDDVIVGAPVESAQPVVESVARSQHDQSDIAPLADDVGQRESVATRQHDVHDDQVRPVAVEHPLQTLAVDAAGRGVPGRGERVDDHLADGHRILDHQHPRSSTIGVRGSAHGSILAGVL